MLPQYQRLDSTGDDNDESKFKIRPLAGTTVFRVSFGKFAIAVVSLPFFAFLFCVVWSLVYFFERSTSTHCGVTNWLPSISAAIGNYQPQRFVWQLAILVHALPRFVITHQYYKYYTEIIRKNRRPVAYTACIFNVVENLALVGLSIWTSLADYGKCMYGCHFTHNIRYFFEKLFRLFYLFRGKFLNSCVIVYFLLVTN